MPLLPLEPFVFPNNLLESEAPPAEGANWWVLHTRPRSEKGLARRLLRGRSSFFLPLYHRRWRCPTRMRDSYNPLFPGYLFLHGDDGDLVAALKTNLVTRSLAVPDQGNLHEDLCRIFFLMSTGLPLVPEDRLLPGTWVEITDGPLAGLTGRFLRHGKQAKVFVEVQFLQRGVSIELDVASVKALCAC